MDPISDTLKGYYNGRETAAAAIFALDIEIPPVNLDGIMPEGITPDKVRKTLNLIPITTLEINLRNYHGHPDEIMSIIATGQWISRLFIINCPNTIQFIPISVTEIDIEATEEAKAIKEIVKFENIKKINLNGGIIDTQTLTNMTERETLLEELILNNTIITTTAGFCRAMARVTRITANNVILNRELMSNEDIQHLLNN